MTGDGDHVTRTQLRSSPRLHLPIHLHLVGLDELTRVCAMLSEAGQLEKLAQPNRQIGNGHILDR